MGPDRPDMMDDDCDIEGFPNRPETSLVNWPVDCNDCKYCAECRSEYARTGGQQDPPCGVYETITAYDAALVRDGLDTRN